MADLSAHTRVRSISLPSRPHPNSFKIETELTKLRTWECSFSTTNLFSAESIQMGLTRVAELFNCVEELVNSPHTQQALHCQHSKQVEEALEGSVGLLDVCSTARDLLLPLKQHIQDLQSALRRRGQDTSIETNIQAYISFRKQAKKDISKSLKTLKRLENNLESHPVEELSHQAQFVIKVTREARSIAVSIFRFLMLFLSTPESKTNIGGWSLISRLISSGLLASNKGQQVFNEVESVDTAIFSIKGQVGKIDVQELRRRLQTLDVSVQGFEAKLDCIFRCLIQNRVSLLNLVTP